MFKKRKSKALTIIDFVIVFDCQISK